MSRHAEGGQEPPVPYPPVPYPPAPPEPPWPPVPNPWPPEPPVPPEPPELSPTGHRLDRREDRWVIDAWAPDRPTCVAEALQALVEGYAEVDDPPAVTTLPIASLEDGSEDALEDLVDEVLRRIEVLSVVPVRFHLAETDDGGLAGDMEVVPSADATFLGRPPTGLRPRHGAVRRAGQRWWCHLRLDN